MERLRLTETKFLRALSNKTIGYYVGADLFLDVNGKRFPKDIVCGPLFNAIHHLRQRASNQAMFEEFLSDLNENLRRKFQGILAKEDKSHAKLLSQTYLRAVRSGDLEMLSRLHKLSELYEKRFIRSRSTEMKNAPLPWHYFAGIAALKFLMRGSIPTKRMVREVAFLGRARYELPPGASFEESEAKMREVRSWAPKRWARVWKDLGLSGLPSAPTR